LLVKAKVILFFNIHDGKAVDIMHTVVCGKIDKSFIGRGL